MRQVLLSAVLSLAFISVCSAQTTPNDQTTPATPGAAPAAENPAHPQDQMPPETKAPAPTPNATTPTSPSPAQSAPTQGADLRELPEGTDIRATLDTPLSTKTARVGDRFTATVSVPVHDGSGNITVPVGSKLNGQVAEPTNGKLASAIKDMGHLNLRFTDIQLPNGNDIPISATLLSVHNTKAGKPFGYHPRTSASTNPVAANTGTAGTFGPPLKGLAVGNQVGGGYVLSTKSKQVDLPAECGLRLRTDRTTPVP